jgi:hypothetical protein
MKLHDGAGAAAKSVATGTADSVHVVPAELNPMPLTATTVLTDPTLGVTVMLGTTENVAITVSATGFPVRVTVQGLPSAVASEFTTKVPVAVPALIEHVEDPTSEAPFVGAAGLDVTVQEVSVELRPLPTNEIVWVG